MTKQLVAESPEELDRLIEQYHRQYPVVYGTKVVERGTSDGYHYAVMKRYNSAD